MPSPPQKPTAGSPAFTTAATTFLFTMPASTISATSRVSASVMRRPLMKSLCLPRSFSVRVSAVPPPCTTATRCPSFAISTTARAHLCSVASSSSATPPIFITIFTAGLLSSQKSFFFRPAIHQVHILHRLAGSALDEIVLAGNNHQSPAIRRQAKTQVAIICVQRELDLRQLGIREHAYESAAFVEI